jgi:hypothetical protein
VSSCSFVTVTEISSKAGRGDEHQLLRVAGKDEARIVGAGCAHRQRGGEIGPQTAEAAGQHFHDRDRAFTAIPVAQRLSGELREHRHDGDRNGQPRQHFDQGKAGARVSALPAG